MAAAKGIGRTAMVVALLLACAHATAELRFNLPAGVTPISREIFWLHTLIFWVCVGIAVLVFAALAFSLHRYRKSRGAQPAGFHEHTWAEVAWTIVPFIILAVMAVPATRTLVVMYDTANPDLTIQVTGSQWKWQYDYLEQGISFVSNLATPMAQRENREPKGEHYLVEVDKPLVLPVGRKIRFLTTSGDVIHSWWVQALGVKRDAIPGFINESWARIETPGVYRGQCAELCGVGHAYMPIVVEAVSEAEFAAWVAAQQQAKAADEAAAGQTLPLNELMSRGEQVYNANCAACHQVSGLGLPPTFPPIKGSAVATGPVDAHIGIVLNGRPGTAMPSFSQLSDLDLAAVITYERNAFGNGTGDTVQGAQVKALRAGGQ